MSNPARLELLREMGDLATQIYTMTKQLTLTGETERAEQEINSYADMVDRREPLIIRLTELKQQADTAAAGDEEACTAEWRKVEQIITDITETEKRQMEIITRIMSGVKSSLKGIKDGRKLSSIYSPMEDLQAGMLDTKK